jgi:hypothetical protein
MAGSISPDIGAAEISICPQAGLCVVAAYFDLDRA